MGAVNLNSKSDLMEAIRYFSDPMVCLETVSRAKWPNGPECPKCASKKHSFLKTRLLWTCLECRKQFSVKVGTIFEDSAIGLDKWLTAMWLLANCKNGISSYELARDIKVTQRSAWFMLQRIRYAMHTGSINKMTSTVEADETFIGGKAGFMHKHRHEQKARSRAPMGKAIVFGLLEREIGNIHTSVVETRRKTHLRKQIREHVEIGAELHTDALESCTGCPSTPTRWWTTPRHAYRTMFIPTAWRTSGVSSSGPSVARTSVLNRSVCSVTLTSSRFNERKATDAERFEKVLGSVSGKRLTYAQVRGW